MATSPNPVDTAYRDWIQFHRTGERVAAGELGDIYARDFEDDGRPEFQDGLYFLYPPFTAWVTVPLAALPRLGAYVALALGVGALLILALASILATLRASAEQRLFAVLGMVASAPWNAAVILGHLSATLVLGPALALLAWSRERSVWTGAALGTLLTKPNWGLPVLLLLVLGRRWRVTTGFMLTGSVLFAVSLPLGIGLWGEWLQTMVAYRELITDGTLPWRHATLFASLQSLLGRPGSDPVVYRTWLFLAAGLFGGVALAWMRLGPARKRFPRLLGVGLLAILVTNPYAHFYDAVLLLPAAVILWTQPEAYRSQILRRSAMMVSLATYLWMHVQFLILMEAAPSLVGVGLSVWLVLELADLSRHRRGTGGRGGMQDEARSTVADYRAKPGSRPRFRLGG